ncbi:MAG: hypothetical protein LCH89_12510 [Proteobacteria bacterium]|nr:hypothetical protein [Pseudomonadota bacterium]
MIARNLKKDHMCTEFLGSVDRHLRGDHVPHSTAPRSPRHAALLVLADASLPRPRALHGTPITALSSAFNDRF